jgi:hypothetical protein
MKRECNWVADSLAALARSAGFSEMGCSAPASASIDAHSYFLLKGSNMYKKSKETLKDHTKC